MRSSARLSWLFLFFCVGVPDVRAQNIEQKFCPVMTEEAVDSQFFTSYQGENVYFCCRRCKTKFEANPTPYLANLPASFEKESSPALQTPPSLFAYLGKFHPAAVHFPIGLIFAAAMAQIFGWIRRKESFQHAMRFCLWLSIPAFGLAMTLGFAAEETVRVSGESANVLSRHEWAAIISGSLALMAGVTLEWGRKNALIRRIFPLFLFSSAAAAAFAGYLGGLLVHGLDHYRW